MIELTGFNDINFYLNYNEIERIDIIPETAIVLLNGKTYIVKNSVEEVLDKIVAFQRRIHGKKYEN